MNKKYRTAENIKAVNRQIRDANKTVSEIIIRGIKATKKDK